MSFNIQNSSIFGIVLECISDAASKKVQIALSVAFIFLARRVIRYYQGLSAAPNFPGPRVGFQPLSLIGNVFLPQTWWNPTALFPWGEDLYKKYNTDTVRMVPMLSGSPIVLTSNLEVMRQIAHNGPDASFIKPDVVGAALRVWGMNLFSANGDTWRTHRRVVGPSFNNALYEHVFEGSVAIYHDMIASEKWTDQNEVQVPVFQDLTHKFALLVIEVCGFGVPFKWAEPPKANDGSIPLQEAIQVVGENSPLLIFAFWLTSLPVAKFRQVRAAFWQVMNFMERQVDQRKSLVQNSKGADVGHDAFTMLVQANEDEAAKYKLSKQELIGNVYTMLIAGHETTATSLAATMVYLALDPEIQTELVEQIESVVGYDRDPAFEDYHKLNKVHSAFLESIRLFPPAFILTRESTKDTVLKIPKPVGQEGFTTLPISKGTMVITDVVALGRNPRYYDEPEKYKPSRWYQTENLESELFTGFGVGARACIGRKFAVTEAVAFLTMLLRDWQVEPMLKTGESKEEWKARLFQPKIGFALGMQDVPVKFTRRQQPL
ncbi:cytochrome P450 [Amanita rubescens]|nr:cytochrome P450 [Amanita rubescens]